MLILVKGAGDIASGVAHRLRRCGASIVMTETRTPTTVRTTVAFSRAVYEQEATLEGVTARLAQTPSQAVAYTESGKIGLLVDPGATCCAVLQPDVVIDAILAKQNLGTSSKDAPIVVALGPGFTAGRDCHAVVETKRGHNLGRVYYSGSAAPNTGIPGEIGGFTAERLLRAPCAGLFSPTGEIGQVVKAGDIVAYVNNQAVCASIAGIIRGLLPQGTPVYAGMKAGDIDPRAVTEYCYTISDKARAVAGGVLEAVLYLRRLKQTL